MTQVRLRNLGYARSKFGPDAANAVVRNSGITIRIHPLDVTVSPNELLEQVREIAETSLEGALV